MAADPGVTCLAYEVVAENSGFYPCLVEKIPQTVAFFHEAFAYQRGSALREPFDYYLRQFVERGAHDKVCVIRFLEPFQVSVLV